MEALEGIIGWLGAFVWGGDVLPGLLVPLLLITGFVLTVMLKGLQFRQLGPALWLALIKRKEDTAEGDVSHFAALMTALAATVGTGNIVGVATAILAGGPGALFWMWVTGLVGMATKYAEAVLGVKYRRKDAKGEMSGGPMFYLSEGIGGPFGKLLAISFTIFAAVAAFGIGNMVQANAVAGALNEAFGFNSTATGIVLMVAAGIVILGGIKSIGRFTSAFVPIMAIGYMLAATVVLLMNAGQLPAAISLVFSDAFTGNAVAGGAIGTVIRYGVARGIFSNESGLGTGGIAAAAAQTTQPVRQALVSMTQTFIDTLVVCSFTGLAIVSTGVWETTDDAGVLTQAAFASELGNAGTVLVALAITCFAFSTLLGWSYFGERCMDRLFGRVAVVPYRVVFVVAIFGGAVGALELLWDIADVLNGMMALPNLIGLLLLSGVIVSETKKYFSSDAATEYTRAKEG